jgi:uncharacterized protein (TIGR02453 family)
MTAGLSPFSGFGKEAVPFLKALVFHQSREWFHDNKKLYESEVKQPLTSFVETASTALQASGSPLQGNAKSSTFRINRDIRFSKDKSPYNGHVSGVFTRTGTKKDTGGVYFHFAPEDSLFASGLWFPASPLLKAFREAIIAREDEWRDIIADLEAKGLTFSDRETDSLKRMPPAFKHVEGEEMQGWMKRKGFVVDRAVKATLLTKPQLVDEVVAFAKDVDPFLQFIWRATDHARENADNPKD